MSININFPLTSEPSHSFLDITRIVCNLFIIDVVTRMHAIIGIQVSANDDIELQIIHPRVCQKLVILLACDSKRFRSYRFVNSQFLMSYLRIHANKAVPKTYSILRM